MIKISRNDLCPCGSGKKYKKCCWNDEEKSAELLRAASLASSFDQIKEIVNRKMNVYRLKVTLLSMKMIKMEYEVSRIIEIKENSTLYELHLAIQRAFNWDNDHMFSFYLSEDTFDPLKEYSANPFGGHEISFFDDSSKPASEFALRDLDLTIGCKFLYRFDYGDELIHRITVENIRDITDQDNKLPRVVESIGESPDQYHNPVNAKRKK